MCLVALTFLLILACDPDVTGSPRPPTPESDDTSSRLQQLSLHVELPGSLRVDSDGETENQSTHVSSSMQQVQPMSAEAALVEPDELPRTQSGTYQVFMRDIEESAMHVALESLLDALDGREVPEDELVYVGEGTDPFNEGETTDLGVVKAHPTDDDESLRLSWRLEYEAEFEEGEDTITVSEEFFVTVHATFDSNDQFRTVGVSGVTDGEIEARNNQAWVGTFGFQRDEEGNFAYFQGPKFTGGTSNVTVGRDTGSSLQMATGRVYIPWEDDQNIREAGPTEDFFFTLGYGTDSYGGTQGHRLTMDGDIELVRTEYYAAGADLRKRAFGSVEPDENYISSDLEDPDYNVSEDFDQPPEFLVVATDPNGSTFWVYTGNGGPEYVPEDFSQSDTWTEAEDSNASPAVAYRADSTPSPGDLTYRQFTTHPLSDDVEGKNITVYLPHTGYPHRRQAFDGEEYYMRYQWPLRGLRPAKSEKSFFRISSDIYSYEEQYWISSEKQSEYSISDDIPLRVRDRSMAFWDPDTGEMHEQTAPVLETIETELPDHFDFHFSVHMETVRSHLDDAYWELAEPFRDVDHYADFIESFPEFPDRNDFIEP